MRSSLILSDLLRNGSSDSKASALLPSAKENEEGAAGPRGFAFATEAFSGLSFERLSENMLVTTPDTVSSVTLSGNTHHNDTIAWVEV